MRKTGVMYIRVLLLTGLFYPPVAWQLLLPCALMLAFTVLAVWFLMRDFDEKTPASQLPSCFTS